LLGGFDCTVNWSGRVLDRLSRPIGSVEHRLGRVLDRLDHRIGRLFNRLCRLLGRIERRSGRLPYRFRNRSRRRFDSPLRRPDHRLCRLLRGSRGRFGVLGNRGGCLVDRLRPGQGTGLRGVERRIGPGVRRDGLGRLLLDRRGVLDGSGLLLDGGSLFLHRGEGPTTASRLLEGRSLLLDRGGLLLDRFLLDRSGLLLNRLLLDRGGLLLDRC
jgi:hypothetical protein